MKALLIAIVLFIGTNSLYACDRNCLHERFLLGIQHASIYYDINPQLLWIIAKIESNFNYKAVNRNKNGSYDYGVFQINSENLKKFGYPVSIAFDPYWSAFIAAYILKQCIYEKGENWSAIDCYNKGSKRARNNSQYVWNFYRVWTKLNK